MHTLSDQGMLRLLIVLLGCEVLSHRGPDLHFLITNGKHVFICRHFLCCKNLMLNFYHFYQCCLWVLPEFKEAYLCTYATGSWLVAYIVTLIS